MFFLHTAFTEQHVSLLHQMNQPVPQSVALLLADARRKEDKRTAKRVANRKSACTSRARKKALVEEMTRTNARLRRQALILALLPDLVIAITTEGEITFCSAQVERVLRYKIDDLVGARLSDLLVPASRGALTTLITELVAMEKRHLARDAQPDLQRSKRRRSDEQNVGEAAEGDSKGTEENEIRNAEDSGRGSSRLAGRSAANSSAAAVVSEQSFPLSVVEVESKRSAANEAAVNSDASSSHGAGKPKAVSSLTTSTNVSRSPADSFSGEDDGARRLNPDEPASSSKVAKRLPSSDDSSSLSSEAKNMRNANENLDRNVRWHNQRMLGDTSTTKTRYHGPKDDVTGQSVTKNNATARLSSLKHVPEQSKRRAEKSSRYESNGDQSSSDDSLLAGVEEKKKGENNSDDSGYRESNESREETSSSGSDTSNSNGTFSISSGGLPVYFVEASISSLISLLLCMYRSSKKTNGANL
jgi:PAS domain-containing protein